MPDGTAKWVKAMSDCLATVERKQAGSPCPVVDHELLASFTGSPDDMCVWCICRSDREKELFRGTEHPRYISALKKEMIAAGFPESAVSSLTTRITSREEIEAGGGRFYFFR